MNERETDELTRILRDTYNPPPETPRDEMWAAIQADLSPRDSQVLSLEHARAVRRPRRRQALGWAAAAAAVLGLGVGIGRMTAPAPLPVAEAPRSADEAVLRVAAEQHLGRTEALLRMVQADGRSGQVDPAMGPWARTLLTQTRLLLDSESGADPAMRDLLEDLELILVQVVAVSEAQDDAPERARSELSLALNGLEQSEVLPRIQAVVPSGTVMAGT